MIKFKLKRKITGKKLRELKRLAEKSEKVVVDNPVWGKKISYKPIRHQKNFDYNHNKPVGVKKYPIAIYELEEKAEKENFKRALGNINWDAFRLIRKYRDEGKKNKVKRLCKAFPNCSPEYDRKRAHEGKIKLWKEKLHKKSLTTMSIFKINLTPIKKEKEWDVRYITSGRVKKVCNICKKDIEKGEPSTTFTKITAIGARREFRTYHTCAISRGKCTTEQANQLLVELPF